jgi:aminopeptidase N
VIGYTQADAQTRAALIDVESYEIFLDLAADPEAFGSRTEIRFGCREPGAATFANLTPSTVSYLQLNGRDLDPGTVLSDGQLHLAGLAASNVLTVDAGFDYAPDGRGLAKFTDPASGAVYVLANGFPTCAPNIFCCFDQLDLLAPFTLAVSAPAGWECVSNGAVTSRPPAGQAGVWRFATVPAMKPYDLALCAGPYVTAAEPEPGDAVELSVRCRATLAGEPGLARIAGVIRQLLEYYERLLQRPYPYPKYDIVFAPGLNASGVQLPAVMMIGEQFLQRAADPEDDYPAGLMAHEVAHLWFGCQVEGPWWDDFWLAESLADYLSVLAEEEGLGVAGSWAQVGMGPKPDAYLADSVPDAPAVAAPADDPQSVLARSPSITYTKGNCVVRQLAALIGDDALRAGLRDYLDRYTGASAPTSDLVDCWSRASGRDLTGWADQWLRTAGVNTLLPELTLAPDGTIASLAVAQEPPAQGGPLRTHRITVGGYVREGGRLRRRDALDTEISGPLTALPGLAGHPAPEVLIINDGDLAFARTRFDDQSWRHLSDIALDVGDPLAEAVCWAAAWDMTMAAELPAAGFVDLVARRIAAGVLPAGLRRLLTKAVTVADSYAPPGQRAVVRHRLAAAILRAMNTESLRRRSRDELAAAFAASAEGDEQLALLRSWLSDGMPAGLELRKRILTTLSAAGQTSDADLDAYATADPVGGQTLRVTCRALRPDPISKQASWTAALDPDQPPHLAVAQAGGIWVPGQEDILAPFRDRYFAEALPVAMTVPGRTGERLARLLFPAILADSATIAAAEAALASGTLDDTRRLVLAEELATLRRVHAAHTRHWPA